MARSPMLEQKVDRREFLRTSGAGALSVGAACPGLWNAVARSAEAKQSSRRLVVVELSGGNDGLNTIIPIQDDQYRKNRPVLAIGKDNAIRLSETMSLHASMKPLMEFWESDDLAVLQNVGYPNPNRSHFRSKDIWQSASFIQDPSEGWLGKLADESSCETLYVGNTDLPLAMRRRGGAASPVISSFEEFQLNRNAALPTTNNALGASDLLAGISQRTNLAAEMAAKATGIETPAGESQFEERLMTMLGMIRTDARTRVFYTSLDGFDTHSRQAFTHANLLEDLARSLSRFATALKKDGLFEETLVLVYSEFGRRLRENGSFGTDHGAAAPMFAIGGGVRGGLHGDDPDLVNLQGGDVQFKIDFRDVYAATLDMWLGIDHKPILGKRDATVGIFR